MTTRGRIVLGIVVAMLVVWAAGNVPYIYVNYLWFDSLGYARVFTTELLTRIILWTVVFVLTAAWMTVHVAIAWRVSPGRTFLQTRGLPWVLTPQQLNRFARRLAAVGVLIVSLGCASAASGLWYEVLQLLNRAPFGWSDPVLGYDASFYVFVMPVLEALRWYVTVLAVAGGLASLAAYFYGGAVGWPYAGVTRPAAVHLALLGSVFLASLAAGYWLDRFNLLLSPQGIVFGAGYVDVHVRMPGCVVMAAGSLLAAVAVVAAAVKMRLRLAWAVVLILAAMHVALLWSYPAFVQWFDVEPNELVRETPYLENNIRATRFAYGLDGVEVRPYSATGTLSLKDVEQVTGTFDNIRIWDWRVLLATYNQIESLRPYYRFTDVDVDRYAVDGRSRQVTLAVRELDASLLNEDSRTWVNLHLLYTHGFGLVMSPVNAVTPEGLPELWIRNIPPQARPDLPLERPAIYFGEATYNYVFVKTTQKEFDHPLGAENRYTEYSGLAGVKVSTFLRRLMFAWYMADWNILLTDSFTPETRILWDRQVVERVRRVAPFLRLDGDPYPVLLEGRIVWVIDGYTRTDRFPYSTRIRRWGGLNYVRNSVKAVVDAYDGTVSLYVADAEDPLVIAAASIYPGLLKDMAEMHPALRAHLRYALDLFEIQAEQYLAYHMTDPRIFYNREDLWQRPVHTFEGKTQHIAAYYFIMNLPGEPSPEYIVMMPFTPARKDNMVAWMAGRCDGKDYGKLLVYTFPKDRLVFGPNQVEARINQNDEISPLLTLWNQHGSRVVRGNLLVIPVGDSIVYVEPLYLKSENAAIPELKRVIVSYQDRIAMRNTLNEALAAAFGEQQPEQAPARTPRKPADDATTPPKTPTLRAKALELFDKAQSQMRSGDWAGYGKTMDELGQLLRDLAAGRE